MEKQQDKSFKNILNENILTYFKENNGGPATAESISDVIKEPIYKVRQGLDELIMGGSVVKNYPKTNAIDRKAYYSIRHKIIEDMHQEIQNVSTNIDEINRAINVEQDMYQSIVDATEKYKEISKNVEQIDKKVNGMYANIISIMSVFVAIFSLITVNANVSLNITTENICSIIWGIILLNIFIICCILVLLIGVKIIIINPMMK